MSGDEVSREVSRMWRVLRTTKQMCADRGYEIPEPEYNVTLEKFRADCGEPDGSVSRAKMGFTARPTDAMLEKYATLKDGEPEIGTIFVQFTSEASVGIKQLKAFAQMLDQNKYWTGIFVTQTMPTSNALKVIPSLKPIELEVFKEEDLLVNISRHELVPKHVLLSQAEKKFLLDRYRLKETQLPRIRLDDPMSRYLGLRRAQVVKIIRKSETAGRYASYRYVI